MGELLAVAMSRWCVGSGLSVRARGCSERGGGLSRSCPLAPEAAGHGAQCGDLRDSKDSPGWDSTPGQYFLVAMALQTAWNRK